MSEVLNTSFFDPIAGFIRVIKPNNYLEINVPIGLIIDKDELIKYFENDVTLYYEAGVQKIIKGTIKDVKLYNYLLAKYYENGPNFNQP